MKIANRPKCYAEAARFAGGLAQHEQNLPAVTAVVTASALSTALEDCRARSRAYQVSRDARQDALTTQGNAKEAARQFIATARDALVPYLGSTWSVAWTQAGFTSPSLAIPKALPQLVETLGSLESYFTSHVPQQNAAVGATEQAAKFHRETLEVALSTVSNARRDQRTKRDARDTAETVLAEKLKAGRKVLSAVRAADDPRWLDFAPEVPGDPNRPDPVEEVEWEAGLPGRIVVRWEPSPRAESYEVEVLASAHDAQWTAVAPVHDPVVELSLTPAAKVQVRVTARNAAGASVPSEPVPATVPMAAAA